MSNSKKDKLILLDFDHTIFEHIDPFNGGVFFVPTPLIEFYNNYPQYITLKEKIEEYYEFYYDFEKITNKASITEMINLCAIEDLFFDREMGNKMNMFFRKKKENNDFKLNKNYKSYESLKTIYENIKSDVGIINYEELFKSLINNKLYTNIKIKDINDPNININGEIKNIFDLFRDLIKNRIYEYEKKFTNEILIGKVHEDTYNLLNDYYKNENYVRTNNDLIINSSGSLKFILKIFELLGLEKYLITDKSIDKKRNIFVLHDECFGETINNNSPCKEGNSEIYSKNGTKEGLFTIINKKYPFTNYNKIILLDDGYKKYLENLFQILDSIENFKKLIQNDIDLTNIINNKGKSKKFTNYEYGFNMNEFCKKNVEKSESICEKVKNELDLKPINSISSGGYLKVKNKSLKKKVYNNYKKNSIKKNKKLILKQNSRKNSRRKQIGKEKRKNKNNYKSKKN